MLSKRSSTTTMASRLCCSSPGSFQSQFHFPFQPEYFYNTAPAIRQLNKDVLGRGYLVRAPTCVNSQPCTTPSSILVTNGVGVLFQAGVLFSTGNAKGTALNQKHASQNIKYANQNTKYADQNTKCAIPIGKTPSYLRCFVTTLYLL